MSEERGREAMSGNGKTGDAERPVAPRTVDLPTVRRIEALGFRAWPAASSVYDGSWLVRLTAGHPSRRLNSVNALDRMDAADLEGRIARLARKFAGYDRPLVFRQTPLAPPALAEQLDREGWGHEGETIVMTGRAEEVADPDALDLLPVRDVGSFVDAAIDVRPRARDYKSGLTELLTAITPEKGMFVLAESDEPTATALAVHDGEFTGLFEVATHPSQRGRGLGRTITRAAIKWAAARGAERIWLQVEADNDAALALYRGLGFSEAYRYHYRAAPDGPDRLDPAEELV